MHNTIVALCIYFALGLCGTAIALGSQHFEDKAKIRALEYKAGRAINYGLRFRKAATPDQRVAWVTWTDPTPASPPEPVYSYFAMKHYTFPQTVHFD